MYSVLLVLVYFMNDILICVYIYMYVYVYTYICDLFPRLEAFIVWVTDGSGDGDLPADSVDCHPADLLSFSSDLYTKTLLYK
jgi:hypothetical protein